MEHMHHLLDLTLLYGLPRFQNWLSQKCLILDQNVKGQCHKSVINESVCQKGEIYEM